MVQKIATCCYCGTRAALKLVGKTHHELACSNCGAPLHDIKHMPMNDDKEELHHGHVKPQDPIKGYKWDKKKKKSKQRKKSLFSKIIDEIEDIFD